MGCARGTRSGGGGGILARAARRLGAQAFQHCLAALIGAVLWAAPLRAEPAFSYRSPFHPEQCDLAIARGRRAIERDASDARGRLLLGEGLLCRGLQDDPWALECAIAELHLVVAQRPDDLFAQLALADAVRKRYPLSAEAAGELERARALLERNDFGAARDDLATYISENLAAVRQARARVLPVVDRSRAALVAGGLSVSERATLAQQLAITGPDGMREAEELTRIETRDADRLTAASSSERSER